MDNKYQNGKIYKLVCDATPIVYYGSTIRSLPQRLSKHKAVRDCGSRELFEKGNVTIELVENYPCNSKKELLEREKIYIKFMLDNFDHRVICNKQIPARTALECREYRKEQKKEYRQKNKESIEKYRQDNKESISKQRKGYRQENKESIKKYSQEYRQKNRDTLNERKNEKFNCECGGQYTRSHKAKHLRTKKHQKWLDARTKTV